MDDLLNECRIIEFPQYSDHRGILSVVERPLLPFDPKRLYYIYEVTEVTTRGCHAHRTEKELLISLAGSFRVLIDDGEAKKDFLLDAPSRGLYIPPLIWHKLHSFARGSVCAVLASERYNDEDYFHSYEDFLVASRHAHRNIGTSRR